MTGKTAAECKEYCECDVANEVKTNIKNEPSASKRAGSRVTKPVVHAKQLDIKPEVINNKPDIGSNSNKKITKTIINSLDDLDDVCDAPLDISHVVCDVFIYLY